MISYQLKKATQEDYHFLRETHHTILKEHITKIWGWDEARQDAFFADEFKTGLIEVIVYEKKNAGYFIIHRKSDHIYIVELLIHPNFQNLGIGTQILSAVIAEAKGLNQKVKLGVFKTNTRAKSLYLRLGFKVFEETKTHFLMEY